MTKIVVETKTSLTGIGWFGAVLFVGSPLVSGVYAASTLSEMQWVARYGYSLSRIPDASEIAVVFGLAGIATALGIILLIIGRQYQHEVQILRPGAAPAQDNVPPFGGTEAERRNLGMK